jgi:hypothetical protein
VIAEEEYEESMYDQRSALKKSSDVTKKISGRVKSLTSSIVASPDLVKLKDLAPHDP